MLMSHVYWFQQDLSVRPRRNHHGVSINYVDILERRSDFLNELRCTIANWVYSKSRCKEIIDKRMAQANDLGNAWMFLSEMATKKFRRGAPQGQFGELLLFNFLQHFFKAIPLLRKMRITTSVGHERFGADAIHFAKVDNKNVFYLGESKCYKSDYKFNSAFKTSLTSIGETFANFADELDLYTYEDFLEPELQEICEDLKNGKLTDVRFELVCLIAYNENKNFSKDSEANIKNSIKSVILERCRDVSPEMLGVINEGLLERINYIVFPVWDLDGLLNDFEG